MGDVLLPMLEAGNYRNSFTGFGFEMHLSSRLPDVMMGTGNWLDPE